MHPRAEHWPWAALLLALAAALGAGPASASQPTVILLSWDGMRHDYPDRALFPALARMQREGWRATRLRPPWPSNTFPGHVTLATGTLPDVHGVVDNVYFDRQRGVARHANDGSWLLAEPLWAAAQRQGVNAATFFWVGSSTPWRGQDWCFRRAPFDAGVPESDKVDQIIAWLDLPPEQRPGLIMSWWHGADSVGHAHGPDAASIDAAVAAQDAQLQRLLAALDARDAWPDTTLIVVSDHGMTTLGELVDIEAPLVAAGIGVQRFGGPGLQHLFLDDASRAREAARLLRASDARLTVHVGTELPLHWRIAPPARRGDVVVSAPAPLVLGAAGVSGWLQQQLARLFGWRRGGHGYDPGDPDMGRGVARAPAHEVRAIDVAASVAALLGIDPPAQSEGRPLWPAPAVADVRHPLVRTTDIMRAPPPVVARQRAVQSTPAKGCNP